MKVSRIQYPINKNALKLKSTSRNQYPVFSIVIQSLPKLFKKIIIAAKGQKKFL